MKYSFPKKRPLLYCYENESHSSKSVAPCLRNMSAKQPKPKVSVVGKPPSGIQRTKVRICRCITQVLFFHNSFIWFAT